MRYLAPPPAGDGEEGEGGEDGEDGAEDDGGEPATLLVP